MGLNLKYIVISITIKYEGLSARLKYEYPLQIMYFHPSKMCSPVIKNIDLKPFTKLNISLKKKKT